MLNSCQKLRRGLFTRWILESKESTDEAQSSVGVVRESSKLHAGWRFGKTIRAPRDDLARTRRRTAPERRPARPRPDRHDLASWRRLLRDLRALLLRQRQRRHRRLRRTDAEARLRQRRESALDAEPRREVHLAHADRRLAQLPRLRRQE